MNHLKRALEHEGVRLSYEDKWLVYDVSTGYYEVYQHNYGEQHTTKIVAVESEEEAVSYLMNS